MKRISFLAASCLISLLLSTAVFGGDMPGPGAPESPKSNGHGLSAICEPSGRANEVAVGTACQEATTDLTTDATIIAIQALTSVY
jgi:hypothetical protein